MMWKFKNMKRYFTIFLGGSMYQDCTDDMRTAEIWAVSGRVWNSRKKANACIKDLRRYEMENKTKRFSVREIKIIY